MEGTQPVEYPAIARAQRLAARRLGGGSSKVKGRHVLDNSAFAESNEEQRSFPEDGQSSSMLCSGSAAVLAAATTRGRKNRRLSLKRRCSLEEDCSPSSQATAKDEHGNGRTKIGGGRGGAADDRRSPSLERTLGDMEQISLRVQEDALALERFLTGEAAPAVQKVFDAAVATHARACRLLSVENSPRTPPLTTAQRATSRARIQSRRGIDCSRVDYDDDTHSTTSSSMTPDREYDNKQSAVEHHHYHACPPAGGNGNTASSTCNEPKRRFDSGDSLASGGGSALPQARRHDNKGGDGERSRRCEDGNEGNASPARGFSDTTDDMGLAVVEVLRVSARSAGGGRGGGSGGGEGDETDESEGGMSRPVMTDISAKIVGLSALIRKKAAEASVNWRWKN